jgi:hypothetical protein
VVLVFYHHHTWRPCLNQLVGLEEDRATYEEKGAKIIALALIQRLLPLCSLSIRMVE